ncbi:MAG: ATP-binding cassette domain-containing protein [Bacteroidetes bacterium]|nr:MAG: ATP-binding cassette domain-containing protein [Bacteroidota bacterium]
MIQVNHLNKSFGDHHVLKDVSASFEKGRVNLIIGASGSGKSVLTKSLVGLHEIDSGEILYNGRNICTMNQYELRDQRKEIGMLFQGSALFDSMTVEQNVMFPLTMFSNMTRKEMLDRVNFCLDRVNLEGRNNLFPAECSGGMQKRIAIARAIAMKPQYLFCDEPNSGLDPQTSILIDSLIKEITLEYNITTIVITHDMNSVIEIGDHINFIYEGKNLWQGTSKTIIQTDVQEVVDFVFASQFMKDIREQLK